MFTIHATKKLIERVKRPFEEPVEPTTALGNWYANALLWKPQHVALFVNERTLLPVIVPLAPARSVGDRLGESLRTLLLALNVDREFIEAELGEMHAYNYAKTASRSVLGMVNDFAHLAEHYLWHRQDADLMSTSLWLSHTPCSPLDKRSGFPDLELAAVAANWRATRTDSQSSLPSDTSKRPV